MKGYVLHDLETKTRVLIPYPTVEEQQKAGRAFHHGKFVMALREKARQENKWVVAVYAPLTIVVDGCFSKFRKELVKESVKVTSHFVATLMRDCPQVKDNHAELVLASPSPVLVYQISSHDTRVLVDVRGNMPKDIKGHLLEHVLPQLPGVLVLGDAFNMRHPLTGGGMSVALNDVVIWRELLRTIPSLNNYEEVLGALRVFHLQRKNNHSFVVNVLAQALYELFAAENVIVSSEGEDYFKGMFVQARVIGCQLNETKTVGVFTAPDNEIETKHCFVGSYPQFGSRKKSEDILLDSPSASRRSHVWESLILSVVCAVCLQGNADGMGI
nr:hypothetical protein BaRGS_009029 [Batillaria attramentaria]